MLHNHNNHKRNYVSYEEKQTNNAKLLKEAKELAQ